LPARKAASGAAPAPYDALLELDEAENRERDRRLVDGDDALDEVLQDRERDRAGLRHRQPVGERR